MRTPILSLAGLFIVGTTFFVPAAALAEENTVTLDDGNYNDSTNKLTWWGSETHKMFDCPRAQYMPETDGESNPVETVDVTGSWSASDSPALTVQGKDVVGWYVWGIIADTPVSEDPLVCSDWMWISRY